MTVCPIEVDTDQCKLDAFSTSAVFGPEGAASPEEGNPRVFGSVSQSRVRLENHRGYSSRTESLMIQMVELQTNLITFKESYETIK